MTCALVLFINILVESAMILILEAASKQARVRFSQHHGFSFRTGRPLSCPTNSSILDHCNSKDHTFKYEYFNVLDSSASNTDLRILESLYILKFNPSINIARSAVQLYIA